MVESTEIEKQKAATIRTLWGVQTVAFCFNGSSSFPLSLSLFPALSACRYSKSFQPSVWQSAVLLSLF